MSKRILPVRKFEAPKKTQSSSNTSSQSSKAISPAKNKDAPVRLMDLPSELRRRILEYSCLVVRPLPNLPEDSLAVYEGECLIKSEKGSCCGRCKGPCQCPSQQCACYRFSTALFYTCRTLSMEAREVCFSINRIAIFDPTGSEAFLGKQPSHLLRLIRQLEYVFGRTDLLYGFDDDADDPDMRKEWPKFIKFVKENLNVQNLTFSIDASRPYFGWVTTGSTQADIDALELPSIFEKIVEPLKELSELKNLYLYWPCFHDLEIKGERAVKGDAYDAYAHGKVILKQRAPGYPRGGQFNHGSVGMLGSYDAQK